MASYIKIEQKDLPKKYQNYKIISTSDGVSQSVYLLSNCYVLKIFNNYTQKEFDNETYLLELCNKLPIASIIDRISIKNKFSIVYNQIQGISLKQVDILHIKEISIFLNKFHKMTKNKTSSNKQIFSKENLKKDILISENVELLNIYNTITVNLKNDGIVHGDLFKDNAKFIDNKLSGVYDFCEACNGDFLFDLAVIAISWCYNNEALNQEKVQVLLDNYDNNISYNEFKKYIKYALLFYTTSRYINKRDYKPLLKKLNNFT